ncbi:MAG: sigma 54-interacting transcriptional regulator, partial [Deltaproteobacteria bacterium]|nr:sigma 54-interacting transcriptional regulator [Deltaproteobacteria bacterium]
MKQTMMRELEALRKENALLQKEMNSLHNTNMAFEAIMGIIADGFLVVGRDENVIEINAAYCDYFGVRREDVIGKSVYKLIPNTKMIEIMDKDLTEIDAIHEFPKTLTASGEYKVAVTRLPVRNEAGEIFASVALIKFSRYTNKLVQSLQEMSSEIEYYRKELSRHSIAQYSFDALPTSSQVFREVKLLAERFARSDLPILLRGETGVGKEVFANAIHNASDRRNGPFICLNCTS